LCGSHLQFLSRGAEIKLQNGTVLNPKPAAEPKAPTAEPEQVAGLNVPEGMTMVAVNPITPDNVDKAVKKLSKKERVRQALDVLQQKVAQKAADLASIV
jgi:hypothetical protein